MAWRRLWDIGAFIGSFLPALLFGVAFANIFQGIPIDAEGVNRGSLVGLLNWYGLLGGVLFVLLFLQHGALWTAFRAEGDLGARAGALAGKIWFPLTVVAVIFLIGSFLATDLWSNYFTSPLLLVIPLGAVACLFLAKARMAAGKWLGAWSFSAGLIVLCTLFGVIGMFPKLLPSSLNPEWSMTIANSSSSPLTLKIMLGVILVFLPLIIVYQFLIHKFFSHPLSADNPDRNLY